MIEILKGTLLVKEPGHAIVDVGGVGYGLDISLNTYKTLPLVDEEAVLYVHTYVREDTLKLFGFSTEEERDVFKVFINVSGIGPKTGLAILSSIPTQEFADAILNRDIDTLTQIPGIGKKTAERLVLELKDTIKKRFAFQIRDVDSLEAAVENELSRNAISALISLDCKPLVARKAVSKAYKILGDNCSLEDLIKEALKHR